MHQYVMKQVKTGLLSPFVMPQIKIKAIYMEIKVFVQFDILVPNYSEGGYFLK